MKRSEIIIDKNIPIPMKAGKWTEFINSLEFGDSFIADNNILQSLRQAQRDMKTNGKFCLRNTDDGFRVWWIKE